MELVQNGVKIFYWKPNVQMDVLGIKNTMVYLLKGLYQCQYVPIRGLFQMCLKTGNLETIRGVFMGLKQN